MTSTKDLLVEIGTEELPPRALKPLGLAFAEGIESGLTKQRLRHGEMIWFATPRRLAVIFRAVQTRQADTEVQKRGPALQAAYDKDGKPTRAAMGFAHACGIAVTALKSMKTDKGEWLVHRQQRPGQETTALLASIINSALHALPVPKRMRWGEGEVEFVRPVHWSLVMFGAEAVACEILGTRASNQTYGHRFHHPAAINLANTDEYATKLYAPGRVIAAFTERQQRIRQLIHQKATEAGLDAVVDPALLDEVTALLEWPVAVLASFDVKFLQLPEEVLIACMQDQQKYFPCRDRHGRLSEKFICIANIDSKAAEQIARGNEKVIRPRLSDAAFFWQQDSKQKLHEYMAGLEQVIFEQKLGNLQQKTRRIAGLAVQLATSLGVDNRCVERAALLSKCDLLTRMVAEFPRLQGVMGRCYARLSGEDEAVAVALDEQYRPRFAGDALPASKIGQILALADRLDTIVGMFAIGKMPSGEKDPFGLRRAAIGSLRIIIERELELDLHQCIEAAANGFPAAVNAAAATDAVLPFMLERLRRYYLDKGTAPGVFDAVLAVQPTRPWDLHKRLIAVTEFSQRPEAASLTAAHKRIANILKQADTSRNEIDAALLQEPAEQRLANDLRTAQHTCTPLLEAADYPQVLNRLAGLRDSVDAFFDEVMVMSENQQLRANRLALLKNLADMFITTADIARL